MSELQALLLGLVQGLTEFLPVSSSGHLELGHRVLQIKNSDNLLFAVTVHCATVLSTLVVFRKDIKVLVVDFLKFQLNESTIFIFKILISVIPVVLVGLFLEEKIEQFYQGQIMFVGLMLLVTAALLAISHFVKKGNKEISYKSSFIIGIAQALAVLPGISRSGATIATGLLLGNKKEETTRFSFLMVIIPIIGVFTLDFIKGDFSAGAKIGLVPLVIGFISAFLSGVLACKWMIRIVKKGKLIYFAIYCLFIGLIAIFAA